jgi:murein tripeptide amidase MpaA
VDANIHAREWITGATATYFINELLNNPDYASWTDDFDFYVLPMANPDGFNFTHTTVNNFLIVNNHSKY